MNLIRWPGLLRRIQGRRIRDLYYEPEVGAVWLIFEDGGALQIEADGDGCSIREEETARPPKRSSHTG